VAFQLSAEPGNSHGMDGKPTSVDEASVEPPSGQRLVEIRCGFAEMAVKEAEAAAVRVVEARRLFEEQAAAVAEAQAAIDDVAMQAAKEAAHRAFRMAVDKARTRGQVEAAVGAWLTEINKVNGESRMTQVRLNNEREAADERLAALTRLSDTAETSATMAAAAIEACRAARAAMEAAQPAEVIEVSVANPPTVPELPQAPVSESASESTVSESASEFEAAPESSAPILPSASSHEPHEPAPDLRAPDVPAGPPAVAGPPSTEWLIIDIRAPQPQAIVRLIRRDRATVDALVGRLAGDDPAARRRWQMLLSTFVDAVEAAAIDAGFFEFPPDSPFWSQFSPEESREIARGLAALGFRYDGFGGFADDRVPIRRDLALAVGQAGLVPVRVRYWPTSDEAAQLLRGIGVSGDAFIASRAPALTLGELVTLLGRRAELLADLWNDWPTVRPMLFSTGPLTEPG
jgi:uncharacterized protein YdbL (DUF1318 family)